MIYDSWSKVEPDDIAQSRMFENILVQADKQRSQYNRNTKKRRKLILVTSFVLLAMVIGIPVLYSDSSEFNLSHSSENITVSYVEQIDQISSTSSLLPWMSEDEIFHGCDTAIFMGTVKSIRNLEINMNGWTQYRALAEITVDKVYRGGGVSGRAVTVLLPGPIMDDVWVEDTEIVSKMDIGVTGIFMPVKFDESDHWVENNATLCLNDIAEYGFLDGERFAFIETDHGLAFERGAFKSISDASTLKEIEQYIITMIHKVNI